MTSKDLSIFNSLRPFSIGFDDMFDQFENMLGNGNLTMQSNYPPYNIRKTGKDNYAIEVALAGFSKKDVGRHNALDKLIGYTLKKNLLDNSSQFLVCSGRLNFDLVQKALIANIVNITYGRGVGYAFEEEIFDSSVTEISATKIRRTLREEGKLD